MKFFYWSFGLVVVLFVLVYLISQFGQVTFNKKVDQDIDNILAEVKLEQVEKITEEDLEDLPEPVSRWLKFSQIVGKEKIKTVRKKEKNVNKYIPWQKTDNLK